MCVGGVTINMAKEESTVHQSCLSYTPVTLYEDFEGNAGF